MKTLVICTAMSVYDPLRLRWKKHAKHGRDS